MFKPARRGSPTIQPSSYQFVGPEVKPSRFEPVRGTVAGGEKKVKREAAPPFMMEGAVSGAKLLGVRAEAAAR